MKNILISACLFGLPCRYDGKSVTSDAPQKLSEKYNLIPVCPEIYGGLPTPRPPSERVGEKTLMRDGTDVTENYKRGAECALMLCKKYGCEIAVLKERSPSCGVGKIYDGSFSGTLKDGDGVTAEYLKKHGITVIGDEHIDELLANNNLN